MPERPLLLIGVGRVALAVHAAADDRGKIYGTTRDPNRMLFLAQVGIEPIIMSWPSVEIMEPLARRADIVVSMPPDGKTDAILASACVDAHKIVYISSTGVYGDVRGRVDDKTEVAHTVDTELRLCAEETWRKVGAIVLRAPAIYSRESGLHTRLLEGSYKIPADGTAVISRIHVDDLARLILAALATASRGETYVVGDQTPVPQIEVVEWLCRRLNLPLPESAPDEQLPATMRASRAVDSSRVLQELKVTLLYPSYKDGFEQCLSPLPAK